MLFKNTLTRDENALREAYVYVSFRQPFMVVMICIFLFITAFETGLFLSGASDPTVPVLAAFCAGYTYYKYRKTVRQTIERDRAESNGGNVVFTTTVTKKNIVSTSSTGEKFRLEFSDIKNCGITKNLIVVLSKNNTSYMLSKEGFEIGNAKSFIQFLKDRGVKIYGKL